MFSWRKSRARNQAYIGLDGQFKLSRPFLTGQSRCHSVNSCENGFLNRRTLHLTWILKRTEICIELAFHSTPPTPLLPAPTLSAGEYKVSGRGGPQPTCSSLEAQNGLPLFLMAFSRLLSCRRGGATRFLLRVHGPCRCLARESYQLGLPAVPVLLVVCDFFDHPLPATLFHPDCHHYGKKKDYWRRAGRSR
jgi:hypothetical protein